MNYTPIQNYVQQFRGDDFIIEAIAELEARGDIDLEIVEGAVTGWYELCQDLKKTITEYLEIIPEIVLPHINWDNLFVDWLIHEDAVAVKISSGIVIIWRSDLDKNTQELLEKSIKKCA